MKELKLFNRVYDDIKRRRDRIINGEVNCIPCSFGRFSEEWAGIEQGKFYGITGVSKAGKTKLGDYMFLYTPFFYAINNPDKVRLKIKYFSLEISEEEKYKQFICHLLFVCSRGVVRISPKELNSTSASNPLSAEILKTMESDEYRRYYEFFEENVEIISHVRNPTGINAHMHKYAKENGSWTYKEIDWTESDGNVVKKKVKDYYIPNDVDEYVICIVDHISLISTESENGRAMNLHESIVKLSSKYFVELRNDFKYIPVIIQQQAVGSEGVENIKLGKLKPSAADLGDCKLTVRDLNCLFGIFSPFKHDLHDYMGYSVDRFRDRIRFMEIIASREGGGGLTAPLYFDGAVDFFRELPLPTDSVELAKAYAMAEDANRAKPKVAMMMINNNFKKINKWQKYVRFLGCLVKAKVHQR
jgi:hypothetical protein